MRDRGGEGEVVRGLVLRGREGSRGVGADGRERIKERLRQGLAHSSQPSDLRWKMNLTSGSTWRSEELRDPTVGE